MIIICNRTKIFLWGVPCELLCFVHFEFGCILDYYWWKINLKKYLKKSFFYQNIPLVFFIFFRKIGEWNWFYKNESDQESGSESTFPWRWQYRKNKYWTSKEFFSVTFSAFFRNYSHKRLTGLIATYDAKSYISNQKSTIGADFTPSMFFFFIN